MMATIPNQLENGPNYLHEWGTGPRYAPEETSTDNSGYPAWKTTFWTNQGFFSLRWILTELLGNWDQDGLSLYLDLLQAYHASLPRWSSDSGKSNVEPGSYTITTHEMLSTILPKHTEMRRGSLLDDALRDLREVRDEANEKGYLEPSDLATSNAEKLLFRVYEVLRGRYEVYPMPSGAIALDAPRRGKDSIILMCNPEGDLLCLISLNSEHYRARYSTIETLPDQFMREILLRLA